MGWGSDTTTNSGLMGEKKRGKWFTRRFHNLLNGLKWRTHLTTGKQERKIDLHGEPIISQIEKDRVYQEANAKRELAIKYDQMKAEKKRIARQEEIRMNEMRARERRILAEKKALRGRR
ncbi:MAG: hypothetical protein KJ955_01365 [Nanoarchaeota archaeon]|nr:hypothetical protein [Nanoarchaeota archaeon]